MQDAALTAGPRRRVLLATSVAESSLTVPGVRVVVDSGLAREPRTDHARGLSALTTVRGVAGGGQAARRTGRAEAPGTVYRCWAQAQDARAPRSPSPEIAVADLTAFALQAACWGDPTAAGLALLDAPPAGALAAARETLAAVGAVDRGRPAHRARPADGRGWACTPGWPARCWTVPRWWGPGAAAEVVALLSEEPPRELGDDLAAVWRAVRRASDGYAARWRAEAAAAGDGGHRGHTVGRIARRVTAGRRGGRAGRRAGLPRAGGQAAWRGRI